MDNAYKNINELGTVMEYKSTPDPYDTTPHHNFESTETNYKNLLPPPPEVHRVDIVGRLFGGTMRDKRSIVENRNQEDKDSNFNFNFGVKNEEK